MYPNGVGTQLRQARESLGLTTDDVAAQTRIAVRFLNALEENRHEELPGLVFTRNFVRQYAEAIKLDPEPLLAALPILDGSHVQLPIPPSSARSARWDSRGKSLAIAAAWVVAIGALSAVGWNFRESPPLAGIQNLYAITQRAAIRAVPAPPAIQARVTPAVREVVQKVAPEPALPVPAASIPAQEPVAAKITPAHSGPVTVVIKATQASWVSLTADGKSSFSGVLKENEIRTISAAEQVNLVTGNAGGVVVSLNGRELDPLGPLGQVRVLRLTAEGLEFLARTPRPGSAPL